MKNHNFFYRLISFLIILAFLSPAYSATSSTTPEPYHDNEFPQFLKDIRRFEIVTLGALPFVSIQTTLTYSTFQYVNHDFSSAYFPNPFAASSYSQDEQVGLLLTSLGICVGIGLTDLIIQLVKRNKSRKRSLILDSDLMITPVEPEEKNKPLNDDFIGPYPQPEAFDSPDFKENEASDDEVQLINESIKISE